MKYKLSEQQIDYLINNHILEQLEIGREENDDTIVQDFKDTIQWFDYMPSELRAFFEKNPFNITFEKAMMQTLQYLDSKYDLKKVMVKDKGKVVGFLIYSYTNKDNEKIENDLVNDDTEYPVLLATAVHPEYRQKGLLKIMISNAPVSQPFLVHTSQVSTPKVWEKLGCKVVQDLSATHGPGNAVQMCNEETLTESHIFKIRDIASMLSSEFGDDKDFYYQVFLDQLADTYKNKGDEGVVKLVKASSNSRIKLEPIGHGRYFLN